MSEHPRKIDTYTDEVSLGLIVLVFLGIWALPAIGVGIGMFAGYLIWGTK